MSLAKLAQKSGVNVRLHVLRKHLLLVMASPVCTPLLNLPVEEIQLWLEHLQCVADNRRRGAVKAAQTRHSKKQAAKKSNRGREQVEDEYHCATCNRKYEEQMTDVDFWILCDQCNRWYCCSCELLSSAPTSDLYTCLKCSQ